MRCHPLEHLLRWNGPLVSSLGLGVGVLAGLLLSRLSLLGSVLFAGLSILSGATLIEPLVGVSAMLFLGPLWAYLRAEVPQVPAQIAQLFFALTVAVWLARGLARRDLRLPSSFLLLPFALFLGATWLSLWDAVELPVYGVPEFIKWVQVLILCLIVGDVLATSAGPRRAAWLVGVLLLTGLFQALVGVYQFWLRGEGPHHFAILGGRFYRAYGTFEQPNPYAGYLGITLALAVGVLAGILEEQIRRRRRITMARGLLSASVAVTVASMGIALVMSWSRGGWLGFTAAAVTMALALPHRARWGLLLVAVVILVGTGLYTAGLLPAAVVARFTSFVEDIRFEDVRGVGINDANYAVIERLAHWQAALEMWRHHFWTGVGFGCYEPAYRDFALINWPIALGHAHNYYLNLAAESGLIGLVAYLLLWGVTFWYTWQMTRRAQGWPRGLAIGLLGAWTHLSVHNFLDNLYVNNVHLHIGVLLGLLTWLTRSFATCPTNRAEL
ncbi:MAG: O-antigen ligase family protein [Anaerolineae bacterium]|nr:O-antigen ligase family protein [Anaerolineae bacterium]